ncbi:MAG: hypothetical protein WCP65_01195 [Bacteroidota bacterium]
MPTITINIEEELKNKIEEKARAANEDSNALIVKAIEKYLALEKVDSIRKFLSPLFLSKDIFTESDIYRIIS